MTITHPYHPLCGQQVEVVRIRRGTDPDLVVQHPDGFHAAIAMSSTDYAATSEPDSSALPPPLLAFDGLLRAVELIERLRQEGRFHDGTTSSSTGADYD